MRGLGDGVHFRKRNWCDLAANLILAICSLKITIINLPSKLFLREVHQPLRLDEGVQCQAAGELAVGHLTDVRTRLQGLHRIEATLVNLLEQRNQGTGKMTCPIIATLHADDSKIATSADLVRGKGRRACTVFRVKG